MSEERIGKYEVLGKIAEGGFGTVYKARDPFIKRVVAIKTCPIHDDEVRHRFFREARIVGGFDHPNVTIVHDFGLEGDRAFLVQEYLPGEDLAEKIRRRDPLSLHRKVGYLLQAARGLAYAHSKGVIHRDIKPANLRILESDQLKVLDFGIAKLATAATHLTQKGVAVGTIGYLSPEQLREMPLDPRTDIFSFGVTAYELLTYRKPFKGTDISSVMRAILEQEPPPLPELVPGIPATLEEVVRRCLEKDREKRYSNFDAVISDLETIRPTLPAEDDRTMTAAVPTGDPDEVDPSEAETGEHPTGAAAVQDPHGTREVPVSSPAERSAPAPERADGTPPPTVLVASPSTAAPAEASPPATAPPAEPRPADETSSSHRVRSALGIAILVALVVAGGLAIAWYVYASRAESPEIATPAEPEPVEEPREAEPAPGLGSLLVDARPWGEVVSVLNDAGVEVAGAAGRSTPLRLDVEPGIYSVVVSHPSLEEPRVCQAEVSAGQLARCDVEADDVDAADYFRAMGWWR